MKHVNYPIGNFLISIKNAVLARNHDVSYGSTKLVRSVAKTLKDGGYVSEIKDEDGVITLKLAYKSKKPVIMNLKIVSRPGLRAYMNVDELKSLKGPSTYIVSTSKGVLLLRDAVKQGVGGEVITEIL